MMKERRRSMKGRRMEEEKMIMGDKDGREKGGEKGMCEGTRGERKQR